VLIRHPNLSPALAEIIEVGLNNFSQPLNKISKFSDGLNSIVQKKLN
jgi:hypothetical protein